MQSSTHFQIYSVLLMVLRSSALPVYIPSSILSSLVLTLYLAAVDSSEEVEMEEGFFCLSGSTICLFGTSVNRSIFECKQTNKRIVFLPTRQLVLRTFVCVYTPLKLCVCDTNVNN